MKYPNFEEEKKLWLQGYKLVVGLDEAGRGPLAGPVVAAAVCIKNPNDQILMTKKSFGIWSFGFGVSEINDSKKLSEKQRNYFYKIITSHPQIEWGIGIVSEKVIDKINILEATKLAMEKAIKNLKPDFLVLDGNFKLNINLPQKSIIKGDQKVISIAAASIIAKVARDEIMQKYHKKYPNYGFDKHKGYPTEFHMQIIKKIGACPIHRKSFRGVI